MILVRVISILLSSLLFFTPALGETNCTVVERFNDEFSLYYEKTVGYCFSISDTVDGKARLQLQNPIAAPLSEIDVSDYTIRVNEILSTSEMIITNVEMEVKNTEAIIRPYETIVEGNMFHTPLANYDMPVYFFRVQVDGMGDCSGGTMCAFGISDDNKIANRIESWKHRQDDDELTENVGYQEIQILISIVCLQDCSMTEDTITINLYIPLDCWLVYQSDEV